jgi:hypothetical protein
MGTTNIHAIGNMYIDAEGKLFSSLPEKMKYEQSVGGVVCSQIIESKDHPIIKNRFAQQEAEFRIRQKLKNAKLEYEAILPAGFLEKLRLEFGLYKFNNLISSSNVLANLAENKYQRNFSVILAGYVFQIGLFGFLFHFAELPVSLGMICGLALPLFGSVSLTAHDQYIEKKDFLSARQALRISFFCNVFLYVLFKIMQKERKQDVLKARLFGEKKTNEDFLLLSKKEQQEQKIGLVEIVTPPPPQEVSDRLLAWHTAGVNTSLLVEEDGFVIVNDSNFQRTLNALNDPIVFTIMEDNNFQFAVLIHQYGKLQNEEKMIQFTKDHFEHLRIVYTSTN